MDPTLTLLLYASLAAGLSALGPLPLMGREGLPAIALGWAHALAAGFMLGAAYLLMSRGMRFDALHGAVGATLGILFVWSSHRVARAAELDPDDLEDGPGELQGYRAMLANTIHSAPEGVAIGAAWALDPAFGIFVVAAMALHNIPEASVLSELMRRRGVRLHEAAALSVLTNVSQVLMAVVTFAVASAAPAVLPWALGFSVGALIYLVMAELLPECYKRTGHTLVATVTLVTMGIVVLLGGAG